VPTRLRDQLSLTVQQVSHGYRGFGTKAPNYQQVIEGLTGDGKQSCSTLGGQRSGSCNQDVACLSEGDPWNLPRRSVGAYQVSGTDFCTGSLVNNTANDQRMLFMTARHCIGPSDAPNVVIFWNYEWPTCRRPGDPSGTQVQPPDPNQSSSGTTFIANTVNPFGGGGCSDGSECSDMMLVEVNDEPNPDWNLYWSGWDRRPPPTICAQGPGNSTDGLCASIHHPGVDEKRITWVADDMQIGSIAGSDQVHWHPFWHTDPPELPNMPAGGPLPPAVTEGGSSGSPLYSADQRLIGVLSGGPAFCGATGTQLSDFYGGLFHGWEGLGTPDTRMRDHLDPLGSNPEFIDGTGDTGFALSLDSAEISQCGFADVQVTVDVSSSGGFADPVTLSTIDLPAGATDGYSTNPVPPPGSSTLTLSNLASAGIGSYSLSVQGESGTLTRLAPISLNLAEAAPAAATIIAPVSGSTDIGTSPTISWDTVAGAVQYEVEIATDPGFTDIVYSATEATEFHVVGSSLSPSTTFYIRVRGINDCGDGAWSEAVDFTTANLICISPDAAIPDDEAAGLNSDLVIETSGALGGLAMTLDITHTWVGDLIITLEHVDTGTSIELMNRADGANTTFGCNSENVQTGVSDTATLSLQADCDDGGNPNAYPEATYRPNDPLASFIGEDLSGTWRLNVSDNAGADTGALNQWCLIPTPANSPLIFEDRFEGTP